MASRIDILGVPVDAVDMTGAGPDEAARAEISAEWTEKAKHGVAD